MKKLKVWRPIKPQSVPEVMNAGALRDALSELHYATVLFAAGVPGSTERLAHATHRAGRVLAKVVREEERIAEANA